MKTRVQKWGNSLGVRIPKIFADAAKLHDGDAVDVEIKKDRLVIKAAKPVYTLSGLLACVTSDNIHKEITTGGKRGKEIW